MPLIHLTTFIAAPIERLFDLSRSIDLHKRSMNHYQEKPVDGVLSGLISLNETVTWKAKHLFKERRLKIKVTQLERPFFFIDEQVDGEFTMMKHEHFFKSIQNGTLMIDKFYFDTPYGVYGKWFNYLYLTKYMEKLLSTRNEVIKRVAESNEWKLFLI
jgi:ligand-binding SRPBCC domain-containing protein